MICGFACFIDQFFISLSLSGLRVQKNPPARIRCEGRQPMIKIAEIT
ncbi:hypothetical protein HMPREF1146_1817 [Prevotella sp. MSX73]|nr:hypothetical protein HMPREF0649_00976 [Segatella buccae D17]EJP31674.1 hypothetical protein HMPREF1146_1817 [Prevotella sp. MSX73]